MLSPRAVLAWRARSAMVAAFTCSALHVQAAVLPPSGDAFGTEVGIRAGLWDAPMSAVSGQWVGRTSSGRVVSLVLRVNEGAVVSGATLDGLVADAANGPRPLVTPTVSGRSVAFSVQPTPCAKALARGVVTFVSQGAAHLNLHAGATPLSVRLWKVS